jgi:hypothetical protein
MPGMLGECLLAFGHRFKNRCHPWWREKGNRGQGTGNREQDTGEVQGKADAVKPELITVN